MKRLVTVGRAFVAALVVGTAAVVGGETLTQSQWMSQVGPSVTDYSVLQKTVSNLALGDRVAFTQNALKAVSRLPVSNEEKAAAFVRTAVGCLEGKTGDVKKDIIAEIFADIPVEYLPMVTEELAKRFDQKRNNLSDDAFDKIASETIEAAAARNAKTDEPSVRNSFVALCFLRAAKSPESLKNGLIAKLPDERQRNLAASWIPSVLASDGKDYSALTTAADVDADSVVQPSSSATFGGPAVDRLLADLNKGDSISGAQGDSTSDSPSTDGSLGGAIADAGGDFTEDAVFDDGMTTGTGILRSPTTGGGLQRTVLPYQNQVITIITDGGDGTSTKHRGHKAE